MSNLRGDKLLGTNNEEIGSLGGAINVHMAGVHNYPINDGFHRHTGTSTTLTVASSVGATSITVASSTGIVAGNTIQIGGHVSTDLTYTKVLSVAGNVLNLNRPLGHARAIGATVEVVETDISSIVGTIASPISYRVIPSSGLVWHIERFVIEMVHSSAGDTGLFGNLTALANGCVLRKYNGIDGTFSTFDVWQSNADIYLDFGDIHFETRSGGGGSYATIGFGSFEAIGVTVKLDASIGDYMEILIQDDITALTSFRMRAQGHLEGF